MGSAGPVLRYFHRHFHNCDLFYPPNFEEKAEKENRGSSTDCSHYGKSEPVVTEECTLTNVAYIITGRE